MNINKIEVGKRIFTIRKSLGLTMKEFGERLGDPVASDSIVSRWEKGKSLPNNERLKKIAEMDNISVDELLYGLTKILDPRSVTIEILGNTLHNKKSNEDISTYSISTVLRCKSKGSLIHGVLNSTFSLNRHPLNNDVNNPIFTNLSYSIAGNDAIESINTEKRYSAIKFEQDSFSLLCNSINKETLKELMDRLLAAYINMVRDYKGSMMIEGSYFTYDILVDWLHNEQLKYEFVTKGEDSTIFKGFLVNEKIISNRIY